MHKYPNQPGIIHTDSSQEEYEKLITRVLIEKLPACPTNSWFLDSSYFTFMVNDITEGIRDINDSYH